MANIGRPRIPEENRRKAVLVRINQRILEELDKYLAMQDLNRSYFIQDLIWKELQDKWMNSTERNSK